MIEMHEGLRTRFLDANQVADQRTQVVVSWFSLMEVMPRLSRFRRHLRLQTIQEAWLKSLLSWSRTSPSQTIGIPILVGWHGRGFMSKRERSSMSQHPTATTRQEVDLCWPTSLTNG